MVRARPARPVQAAAPPLLVVGTIVLFALALTIMLVIKTYVVQAFYIPSSSMENTLEIGDKVLVNKLIYHFRSIERGDVVVFNGEGSWDPPSPPQSSDPVVRLASEFGHAVTGLFGSRRACTTTSSGSSGCPVTTSPAATRRAGSP